MVSTPCLPWYFAPLDFHGFQGFPWNFPHAFSMESHGISMLFLPGLKPVSQPYFFFVCAIVVQMEMLLMEENGDVVSKNRAD